VLKDEAIIPQLRRVLVLDVPCKSKVKPLVPACIFKVFIGYVEHPTTIVFAEEFPTDVPAPKAIELEDEAPAEAPLPIHMLFEELPMIAPFPITILLFPPDVALAPSTVHAV
jgi:hypothetical protein